MIVTLSTSLSRNLDVKANTSMVELTFFMMQHFLLGVILNMFIVLIL